MLTDLGDVPHLNLDAPYYIGASREALAISGKDDLIRSGGWTLDKMMEIGSSIAADLDNNGVYNVNDAYAFTYINDVYEGFVGAGGIKYAELDKNGVPVLMYEKGTAVDRFMSLFDALSDESISFNIHKRAPNDKGAGVRSEIGMFMNRQAMFHSIEMLDLIFSSTTYDAGAIFNFGKLRDSMRTMYINGNSGFASFFESVRTMVQSEIDALMATIE